MGKGVESFVGSGHGKNGQPQRIGPQKDVLPHQQGFQSRIDRAQHKYGYANADTNQQICRVFNPEHRLRKQDIPQGAAADARDSG